MYHIKFTWIFILSFTFGLGEAKSENALLEYLSKETGVSHALAKEQVEEVFRSVENTLIKEGIVKIPSFGTFYLQKRKPWTVKHPRTGKLIKVPSRLYPRYRSSKKFKDRIRALDVDKISLTKESQKISSN